MGKSIKDAFKNIIWFKFKAMYGKIVVSWFVFEVTLIVDLYIFVFGGLL